MKPAPATEAVWDPLLRCLHWLLVVGMVGAWVTTSHWSRWHELTGKAVLAVVALRVAWGLAGPRHARFRSFVRGPRATLAYARLLLRAREPRHVGHNPLGGWMVLALLAGLVAVCASGWLFTTDRFWGDDAVSTFHEIAAWAVVVLVVLHVLGVAVTGRLQRENLVAAMVTGRKRAAAPDDVP